jgi:hypothetical protein
MTEPLRVHRGEARFVFKRWPTRSLSARLPAQPPLSLHGVRDRAP